MLFDLDILRLSQALATHAVQRSAVIARNVANADTPGYLPRDLPDFATIVSDAGIRAPSGGDPSASTPGAGAAMRRTRPGHLGAPQGDLAATLSESVRPRPGAELAPNGNGVSLEAEMLAAAETRQRYDLALGVYSKSLAIMRSALGRR